MNKKAKICISVFLVLVILAVLIPVIISMGYTYPCEDDFSFEAGTQYFSKLYGDLRGGFIGGYFYYSTWQGTYLADYLFYSLGAYGRWGITGFHIVMIVIMLIFISSVIFTTFTLVKDKMNALVLTAINFICIFNTSESGLEQEFFCWYTGTLIYELEFALTLITFALALRLKDEQNKRKVIALTILSVITGVLASGGTLEIASFNCSWLLVLLLLNYKDILRKKVLVLPFAASFLGALVNACAKGNFVRRNSTISSDYNIFGTLSDTLYCWKNEWNKIFQNDFFVILLVVTLVVCIISKTRIFSKGISTVKFLILMPAVFLIQFFTVFPVLFGYHGSDLLYRRTTYTYEILAKLTILFLIVCFAQWWWEHVSMPKIVQVSIAVILVAIVLVNSKKALSYVKTGFSYQAAKELATGQIQDLYEFRLNVLALMEQGEEGKDVYITAPAVPSSKVMYGMGLTMDAASNCNSAAAWFYGYNSLSIDYSNEADVFTIEVK